MKKSNQNSTLFLFCQVHIHLPSSQNTTWVVWEPCLPKSHLRVAFFSTSPPQILSKFHSVERQPWAVIQLLYKLTHPSLLLHLAHTASPWSSLWVLRTHLCFAESEPFNKTLIMVGKFHLKEKCWENHLSTLHFYRPSFSLTFKLTNLKFQLFFFFIYFY